MKFSEDFIERVREANDIVEYVGQHVQLSKAGSSYRGLCPFPNHIEKTPSFFVSDVKQLYHCFGCKKSGSIFNFMIDLQGLTFPEAVETLADRARLPVPVLDKTSENSQNLADNQKKILYKINRYVGAIFHRNLKLKPKSDAAWQYIKKRGLTDEIFEEFKLGLSTDGWSDLSENLKSGHAPVGDAEKLGLIKKKSDGQHFDLFRQRLMFPILSPNGHVLGFGGRSLSDQQPKYLNSPESPVFSKGKTLYGLNLTAKYIRALDEAYVVEGYMDLITLYQFGVKNVVATLGTALTSEHTKILKRLCSHVVVLFDSDEAGLSAADKSLPLFLDANLFSRHLTLPGECDPDDYLRNEGLEKFTRLSKEAPDHFVSYLNRQLVHFKGRQSEKVEVVDKMLPLLEHVRDQRLKTLYSREVADRLTVDPQWLVKRMNAPRSQLVVNNRENKSIAKHQNIPREEEILVQFMLQNSRYLEIIRDSGSIENFMSDEARMLAQRVVERYCKNPGDFDRLGASLITEGYSSELLTSHIGIRDNAQLDESGEMQLIQDCLSRVKERHLKLQTRNLLTSLKSDSGNTENLEAFMKIAQEQKGLKNP